MIFHFKNIINMKFSIGEEVIILTEHGIKTGWVAKIEILSATHITYNIRTCKCTKQECKKGVTRLENNVWANKTELANYLKL